MPRLNIPSRTDVEKCIAGLAIEDEREAAAIREFYARERREQQNKRVTLTVLVLVGLAILTWWASR